MKGECWTTFSFTESLAPPAGWKTDYAILSTYSADLVVIVTVLLALTGCDLDDRRTGSRAELVNALEVLKGKVCVLAQASRVTIPNAPRPILKLLDKFLRAMTFDEKVGSWHPKFAIVRYHNLEDPGARQWRIWLGSRNLTRAMNWEAGLLLVGHVNDKGQRIEGLTKTVETFARYAKLSDFSARTIAAELDTLTWECPAGCEVRAISLLGPKLSKGFPTPPSDVERVLVVSPFLDAEVVRTLGQWGGTTTRRTLVSISTELDRLHNRESGTLDGYELRTGPLPELPGECASLNEEEMAPTAEPAESEEFLPSGLHAKLILASNRSRRDLWLGSANATQRGWLGRNFEIVAEMSINHDVASAIEEYAVRCERFAPSNVPPEGNADEDALEQARKLLSSNWPLRQRVVDSRLEVTASTPPPLSDNAIALEVAALSGTWVSWPRQATHHALPDSHLSQRSDFLQVRISRGDRVCAWIEVAPCDPPPDKDRDRAVIGEYLNPRDFLLWLRGLLANQPVSNTGGDWDAESWNPKPPGHEGQHSMDLSDMPTVEEILRSWARDPSAFTNADDKVRSYLTELERCATERGATADVTLLGTFRGFWESLASELR